MKDFGRSIGFAYQKQELATSRSVSVLRVPKKRTAKPDRTHQRPNKANAEANALASWDNEGGAAKGASQKDRDDLTFLDKKEERILRCLGAAVIVQWNDLPTDIQHELFEHAMSMGSLHHTADLKSQIARFLHKHKDQEIG